MEDDPLPAYLREKVEKLRRKGPEQERRVDKLLQRRAEGSPERRRQIDELLVQMGRPSPVPFLLAGVAVFVGSLLGYHFISQRSYDRAVAAGVPTVAQVKRLDPGDCTLGREGFRCLRLTLEMHPPGRAPYAASLTRDIALQWMSRVQPGSWLTVALDPADSSKVYFDERTMAVEAPAPVVSQTAP